LLIIGFIAIVRHKEQTMCSAKKEGNGRLYKELSRPFEEFTCSSSYGGSFSISSYAYASQSYDAFFFYHKA